ncbi:MAG: hypothetical protein ABSC02_07375 [Acidobacteriota bacterium]|jgi:hypothetical protein
MSKAKSKLPQAPVASITRLEIQSLKTNLCVVQGIALRALDQLEMIDVRASTEFAESMRIIRGLQQENKGGEA